MPLTDAEKAKLKSSMEVIKSQAEQLIIRLGPEAHLPDMHLAVRAADISERASTAVHMALRDVSS